MIRRPNSTSKHPNLVFLLAADPYELANLVEQPGLAALVRELQQALAAWFADALTRQGNLEEPYQLPPELAE